MKSTLQSPPQGAHPPDRPRGGRAGAPDVSVVVPIVERHGDLRALHDQFAAALDALGRSHEFVFVVSETQRRVLPVLEGIAAERPGEVVILLVGGRFGEAGALTLGLRRARAEVLMTLAAWFQVDPSGLPDAFAELDRGVDVVAGCRWPRRDAAINRVQSRLFHGLLNALTGSRFHDTSCGFKLMRRRVARALNVYGDQHRFIPVLARHEGFAVKEVRLPQRHEDVRARWFTPRVYAGRLLDIVAIFFLTRFTRMPLRFFGLLGAAMFGVGVVLEGIVLLQKLLAHVAMADRPLLLLGVLLMVLGVQTFALGLVSEILIFTHARNLRVYRVAGQQRRRPRGPRAEADAELPVERDRRVRQVS